MSEEVASAGAITEEAPAAVVPPTAGEAVAPKAAAPTGAWFDTFTDDDKAFLTAKGWDKEGKGPADVVKGYRNLEKMRGDPDKMLTIPDPADAEAVAAFRTKLGVPEAPEGYTTPTVELNGQPMDGTVFAGMSHRMALTPEQHSVFVEGVGEYLNSAAAAEAQASEEKDVIEKNTLEREWGGLTQENYQAAAKAAKRFGLDTEKINRIQKGGLGYRETIELFTSIGRAFGEGKAPEVDSAAEAAPFGLTPTVAKERLNGLMKDSEFRKRMDNGDADARGQWDRLKKVAFQ